MGIFVQAWLAEAACVAGMIICLVLGWPYIEERRRRREHRRERRRRRLK
jgi:energy-converting hydrogenase Eha subunit A